MPRQFMSKSRGFKPQRAVMRNPKTVELYCVRERSVQENIPDERYLSPLTVPQTYVLETTMRRRGDKLGEKPRAEWTP